MGIYVRIHHFVGVSEGASDGTREGTSDGTVEDTSDASDRLIIPVGALEGTLDGISEGISSIKSSKLIATPFQLALPVNKS